MANSGAHANPLLKNLGVNINYSKEEIEEYIRCSGNPEYFIENYIKIVSVDKGLIPFKLWDFQKDIVEKIQNNRFVICKLPRQSGKCVFINTIVTIRDKRTLICYDITIGDLYELVCKEQRSNSEKGHRSSKTSIRKQNRGKGLCEVSLLRNDIERFDIAHLAHTQNQSIGIFENTPLARADVFRGAVGESIGIEESCLSTWRTAFSILEEVSKIESQSKRNSKKSYEVADSEPNASAENRILAEADRWKYDSSARASVGKAAHILVGEMHSETRKGEGNRDLEYAATEVAKYTKIEATGRNHEDQCAQGNELYGNFFDRTIDIQSTTKTVSRFDATENFDNRELSSISIRHAYGQEDHRISWGLLARKSNHLCGRLDKPIDETICEGNFKKRQYEIKSCGNAGIQNLCDLGERLQTKPVKNFTRLHKLSDTVNRKFINSIELQNFEVLSESGYQTITHIHKTIKYVEWELKTETHNLTCADDHIVFLENGDEVFVKTLEIGDRIKTESGIEDVVSCLETDKSSNMFDLTVDSEDHSFFTNGILSHNSTTVIGYLLWNALFNDNQNIAILANKGRLANELLAKIKLTYEHIPKWIQQGVATWNRGSLEFENGSKITAASTSSSAIRGGSYSLIFLDEFAFVPRNIAEEFFQSVYPTISSGTSTKIIIVSTPNGMNHFYKMWTDSQEKRSDYINIEVHWSAIPGRDEEWKKQTIRNTSEQQFEQEFNCVDGNTYVTVRDDETKEEFKMKIGDLYNWL